MIYNSSVRDFQTPRQIRPDMHGECECPLSQDNH